MKVIQKIFILVVLFTSYIYAQTLKTIGIPKDVVAPTYKKVLDDLRNKQISFKLISLNFNENPKSLQKKIDQDVDILFVTGDYLSFTLNKIKPQKTNIVFLGVKDLHNVDAFKNNATGIFRSTNIIQTVKMNQELLINNTKSALLVQTGSKFETLSSKIALKAKKAKLSLDISKYNTAEDFDTLFQKLKKEHYTSVLLFPPSVNEKNIPKLVLAQNKYNLPVLTQRVSDIKKGIVGGAVLDYDLITPLLSLKIQKLIQNESIESFQNDYVAPVYAINFLSVTDLNLQIEKEKLAKAKVIY